MPFYRPTPEHAWLDVKLLEPDVPLGWLLRNAHRWAGNAMLIAVALHMARVFLTGSYKPPRQLNWVIGVGLFLLTLALSFTGYLLPWDQLSLWAVTIGMRLAAAMPLVGADGPGASWLGIDESNDLRSLIAGGASVGGPTLIRFYALHCFLLPAALTGLAFLHFWRVRRDGGVRGPL